MKREIMRGITALVALCLPVLALGATPITEKAAAHKAQLGITAKAPVKKMNRQAVKGQRDSKQVLLLERKALLEQMSQGGSPAIMQRLQANQAQIAACNQEMAKLRQGGGK